MEKPFPAYRGDELYIFVWYAHDDEAKSPWYRVQADDKRRARLNCIAHFLSLFPYEEVPFTPPEPGERQERTAGVPDALMFRHEVPQIF